MKKLNEYLLALTISLGLMYVLFFIAFDFKMHREIAKQQATCINKLISAGVERKDIQLTEDSCKVKTPQ